MEYKKRLDNSHSHRSSLTVLEHIKLKEENYYLGRMLNSACDEYERLVCDVISGKMVRIGDHEFYASEVTD